MTDNVLFRKIIEHLKKEGWKEQLCGIVGFSGSTGTNLCKTGKVLSLSLTEEGHLMYPDPEEFKEMFGEV